jgi:hypothetical protein
MTAVVQPRNSTLTADPTEPAGMTPDSLMAFCSTRLSSLDTQMQEIFDQQTQSAATINDLNTISSDLNDLPGPSTDTPPKITMSAAQYSQIVHDYDVAIDDLSPKNGSPSAMHAAGNQTALGQQLQADHDSFIANCTVNSSGTVEVPASVVTNVTQNLKTYTSSLNSDAEMQMINLQSLMSSRQTAVELSTNMMETLASTDQSIAANLKTA